MIATRIRGGLGNQLFQYATGRALALRLKTDLALDLRDWSRSQPYEFGLNHFNIRVVDPVGLPMGRGDSPLELLGKIMTTVKMRTYREAHLGYDPQIESLGDDTLLKGYWQTERYFADHDPTIREDLSFAEPPAGETARLLDEITRRPAVSLHIRRGDYVTNTKYAATHGTTAMDYYRAAARHVAETANIDPVIYAFSDDPAWVEENLALAFEMRFVSHNDGSTAHDDLRLMSACRHHVIANSSFSWWGAWLNPNSDKVVVAPKQWYVAADTDNPDIVPETWVRM